MTLSHQVQIEMQHTVYIYYTDNINVCELLRIREILVNFRRGLVHWPGYPSMFHTDCDVGFAQGTGESDREIRLTGLTRIHRPTPN